MVASGKLSPGDPLPSVRQVAQDHAVNTMTISKAYSLLEAEGMLERQRGKVMTIAGDAPVRSGRQARLKHIEENIEQLVVAAKQLELSTEDLLQAVAKTMAEMTEQGDG